MASTIEPKYGTNNQTITCTVTSLANNGQQGSAAIDNTSNLFLDQEVMVIVKSAAAATSATGYANVWGYGTANGGTNYTDGVTGTNASQTLTSPPNVVLLGVINVVANSVTYVGGPYNFTRAFGGVPPDHWGIVVENKSGATFDASTGSAFYQGVQMQTTP